MDIEAALSAMYRYTKLKGSWGPKDPVFLATVCSNWGRVGLLTPLLVTTLETMIEKRVDLLCTNLYNRQERHRRYLAGGKLVDDEGSRGVVVGVLRLGLS